MTLKKPYLLLITLFIFLVGCTKSYKVNLKNPPKLPLASNVKSIGVFNRTLPHEDLHTETKIDELISLEGVKLDQKGSSSGVARLNTLLGSKERFNSSKVISHIKDTTLYVFLPRPEPLSWDQVSEICKMNKVDALIVLESYDTESSFTQSSAPVTTDVPLVGPVTTTKFYVSVLTKIKAFWRIYDNVNRTDIYTVTYDEVVNTKAEGVSLLAAYNAVTGREQKVITKSQAMARDISKKMEPYSYWVDRRYYHKGTSGLKSASKRVETNSWDDAINIWKRDIDHPKNKIKGRALFNLALGAEVKGDIEKAISYATDCYHVSGDKKALEYIRALKYIQRTGIETVK